MAALSEREMRILAFERSWWRLAGAKEREILEVFGVPVTRYYQLLNELIDRPEAAEFDPVLVDQAAPAARQAPADPLGPAGLTRACTGAAAGGHCAAPDGLPDRGLPRARRARRAARGQPAGP